MPGHSIVKFDTRCCVEEEVYTNGVAMGVYLNSKKPCSLYETEVIGDYFSNAAWGYRGYAGDP